MPCTFLPLEEAIADARRECWVNLRAWARRAKEQLAEEIAQIESTRLACCLLQSAGVEVDSWGRRGFCATVALGEFRRTKRGNRLLAEAVRRVRLALGCRLEKSSEEVEDGRRHLMKVTLKGKEFPGLRVTFLRKVAPGDRCKLVKKTSTYYSLECGLPH
jgi:hypothetical protein